MDSALERQSCGLCRFSREIQLLSIGAFGRQCRRKTERKKEKISLSQSGADGHLLGARLGGDFPSFLCGKRSQKEEKIDAAKMTGF